MWWDQAVERIAKAAGGSMNLNNKDKTHSIDITPRDEEIRPLRRPADQQVTYTQEHAAHSGPTVAR